MITINIDEKHLDLIYNALGEIPGKFSHTVMSALETEVARVRGEEQQAAKAALQAAAKKIADEQLAKSKGGLNQDKPNDNGLDSANTGS